MHRSVAQQTVYAPERAVSRAGDLLLVPIGLAAFWTLAYQFVLVTRLPAETIEWFFLALSLLGFFSVRRFFQKTKTDPGAGYVFHPSQLLVLLLALGCGVGVLFILSPNQDDVVYFHRALSQLAALSKPIFTRQTSVDLDAAAFSPVHLATSHEMLMAFLGHFLGVDPLYFYQIVGHVITAFSMPFIFYWCVRSFGVGRWLAAFGAVCAVIFLLIDSVGLASFGNTAFCRMWQGKAIVWVLFPPLAICLSYRFLRDGKLSDVIWLTLLVISGVGLSNSALYLVPAAIGCCCLASLATHLLERKDWATFWGQFRRCCFLAIPLIYPVTILLLLKLNIIRQPIDTHAFGPALIPWRNGIDFVVGPSRDLFRDLVILILIPLAIVTGKRGAFLLFYIGAICLLCLNPLLDHLWMKSITASCYFRLVYLLPLPLVCAFFPLVAQDWIEKDVLRKRLRIWGVVGGIGIVAACIYCDRGRTIGPRTRGWKSPSQYQLVPANLHFAHAAGDSIATSKLLAPCWTASCELPLIFPRMKVVAPRLVTHYFANVGNAREGALRRGAQAFVEGEKNASRKRASLLWNSFRLVIQTGRANALAVPKSESARVLAALQSIDPRWHSILEAGGLVLILPKPAPAGS